MPGGDRTGPTGQGPMTGRAAGYCAGFEAPGYANPVPGGRGFGMGGGKGRGFGGGGHGRRNRFYATGIPGWASGEAYAAGEEQEPDMEKQALKNQARALQWQLDRINRRIAEFDSGTNKD